MSLYLKLSILIFKLSIISIRIIKMVSFGKA
jgi:hypothetical protein